MDCSRICSNDARRGLEMKVDYNVTKEPQEVVSDIDETLREAWTALDKPHETDVLSKAVLELPTLLNGLGYYLSVAEAERDEAKDTLEYTRDKALLQILNSSKIAKNRAELEVVTSEEYRSHMEHLLSTKNDYRLLKNKYDAVSKSFEGMRSRLSIIKEDPRR